MVDQDIPTKAQQLASVLTGNGRTGYRGATVQRSHRFLLHHFMLIENMAKLADCSVAAMINQVLDVGVEALEEQLPEDISRKIRRVSEEQANISNGSVDQTVGKNYKK